LKFSRNDVTWTKQKIANKKEVVKVNKQYIADDQTNLQVCLFNQTPWWHTFYQTVTWGSWVQIFKNSLSSNWSFDFLKSVCFYPSLTDVLKKHWKFATIRFEMPISERGGNFNKGAILQYNVYVYLTKSMLFTWKIVNPM